MRPISIIVTLSLQKVMYTGLERIRQMAACESGDLLPNTILLASLYLQLLCVKQTLNTALHGCYEAHASRLANDACPRQADL